MLMIVAQRLRVQSSSMTSTENHQWTAKFKPSNFLALIVRRRWRSAANWIASPANTAVPFK
jgi:hypothetical protein